MKDDFEIIRRTLPRAEVVTIYPVADVHLGSAECDEQEWDSFRSRILSEKNSYIILHGDLMNNNTRSSVGSPYADTMRPREQKKLIMNQLEPLRDKILCAVSGNHERRSLKDADDDPTYDIMCKLDLEDIYRENMAFLHLGVGSRPKDITNNLDGDRNLVSYGICVTHGSGGGVLSGGTINRNERFARAVSGIDALIVGHSHNGMISRPSQLVFDVHRDRVYTQSIACISTTSWQRFVGYASQKMLQPRQTSSTDQPMLLRLSGREKYKRVEVVW